MPVIYIIGDSTVEDNKPPFRGWGWALPRYVKDGVEAGFDRGAVFEIRWNRAFPREIFC